MFRKQIDLRYKHLKKFQKTLRYRFRNRALLDQALTPKAYCNANLELDIKDNERLEFLGDAVLNLSISVYLYSKYPFYSEGHLTKLKSQLVSRSFLLKVARRFGLSEYIRAMPYQLDIQPSVLACTLEAVIAAVYLDGGFKKAYLFIISSFEDDMRLIEEGRGERDYKSLLQEISLKEFKCVPKYELISEAGPQHKKSFKVSVSILGSVYGRGSGNTKKEAHQASAKEALEQLEALEGEPTAIGLG